MCDFSIVVPTYDRPESLVRLLSSLTELDYPSNRFEVIVVDDGGSVPLEPRLSGFHDSLDLTLLRQQNAGPGAARNYAAKRANGRHLAFTDDDCLADPGWLQAMADALEQSDGALCGGRTLNGLPHNVYSQATQLLADHLYQCYNPTDTDGAFFPTNNMAVPREAFLDLGGFDRSLRFGEDRDLCHRWAAHGHAFISAPEAVVRHVHHLTMRSFLRLHFCYGGGTYRFRRGCRKKGLPPVSISPPSWYLNLVLSGVRKQPGELGLAMSALLAASQAACGIGMFWNMLLSLSSGSARYHASMVS